MSSVLFALVLAAALFGPSPAPAAPSGTLEQIRASGTVRIGYREDEPPMSFHDENGGPVGYSIDLCARIVDAIRSELGLAEIATVYVPVTATDRFTALTGNRIDILCGSTTKTLARGRLVDFTQLTFATGASLLSLADAPIAGLGDLRGKKVAVVRDTTTIEVLKAGLKAGGIEADVVPVDTSRHGMKLLRAGEVAALSADQVVLVGLVLTAQDPERFGISPNFFSFEPFALAVRRDDADFRLVADGALSRLYRTGEIDAIYKKWFGILSEDKPALIESLYRLNSTPE